MNKLNERLKKIKNQRSKSDDSSKYRPVKKSEFIGEKAKLLQQQIMKNYEKDNNGTNNNKENNDFTTNSDKNNKSFNETKNVNESEVTEIINNKPVNVNKTNKALITVNIFIFFFIFFTSIKKSK